MPSIQKKLINKDVFFTDPLLNVYDYQAGHNRFEQILQAIVDEDIDSLKNILDSHPGYIQLLIKKPQKNHFIESQLIKGLTFNIIENPLLFAVKRKQMGIPNHPGVIETLLHYLDKSEKDLDIEERKQLLDIKTEALTSWTNYTYGINEQSIDTIIIPPQYQSYLQSLIDIFNQETFPNGVNFKDLSPRTESALNDLLNKLVPEQAVKIDDYLDVDLFLYAAYNLYANNLNRFQSWDKQDAFCIRVLGLIQSAQRRQTAEIFCQGLYAVVVHNAKINTPTNLKLSYTTGTIDFYHSHRNSRENLGFDYVAGSWEGLAEPRGVGIRMVSRSGAWQLFRKMLKKREQNFQALKMQFEPCQITEQEQSHFSLKC